MNARHVNRGQVNNRAPSRRDTCIMVFARAPLAGRCKTRLIPALGADGAAALHRRLVWRMLGAARDSQPATLELWCVPDTAHPFFNQCRQHFAADLLAQCDGDLGARMRHALERALQHHRKAILVGSDIPGIDADYLRAAAGALDHSPAVFGPAEDGGYVLVGLSESVPDIFSAIDWGGPAVMAQTRERLSQLGLNAAELPLLWDVDRPEDLMRLDLANLPP